MIVVFRGPSLSGAETHAVLGEVGLRADVRGPAAQGDVLAAVRDGAEAIVLIDGVYERVAAVWHKEILDALARGVRVVGAASMGALRAAECAAYGMCGYGEVYRQVVVGEIVADGDVAVAHRDAEGDHAPTSVALVDVRATVAAARDRGDLDEAATDRLLAAAADLFFATRSWAAIGGAAGLEPAQARRLRDQAVSVKADDARGVLRALPVLLAEPVAPRTWTLAESEAWQRALAEPKEADPVLLDLLRLGGRWTELMRAGLVRAVAAELVGPVTEEVALAELAQVLPDPARWGADMGLDERGLADFARRQAQLTRFWGRYGDRAPAEIVDHLRVEGTWGELVAAAAVRREADPSAARIDGGELVAWWESVTGTPASAAHLGFDDDHHLQQALRREHAVSTNRGTP